MEDIKIWINGKFGYVAKPFDGADIGKYSKKRRFGNWGEDIVCDILQKNGMELIDRNYLKRFGEIDIVARKGDVLHFVEVKTVSRETLPDVNHETYFENMTHRPEENVDKRKILRMKRVITMYLEEKQVKHDVEFQIDIASVVFYIRDKKVNVDFIDDVII